VKKQPAAKTVILGIGNILLGDEGIGCHIARLLSEKYKWNNVDIVDGGTGGFHLLSFFENYSRIILIDATMDNKPVGTVSVIQPKFASDFPTALSAHDIGLRDLIETAVLTSGLPKMQLITITIKELQNMTLSLSPEVEQAIPKVIDSVLQLLGESEQLEK